MSPTVLSAILTRPTAPPLQVLLAAGDHVADVDRLAGLGVGHQAVVGVLVLAIEDVGQGLSGAGEGRVGGDVVDALVPEPQLTLSAAQPFRNSSPVLAPIGTTSLLRPPHPLRRERHVDGRTPRWDTASITAFWTAGMAPIVPDSPNPLAPSSLTYVGVSMWTISNIEARRRR